MKVPRQTERMQAVQAPIIPVVGELLRQHPGAISLGQGVVHYGPPPEAIDRIAVFLANPENHKYNMVQGIPELVSAIEQKLEMENAIRVSSGRRVVVTAGGNMAFVNAVLAIADPGDEVIILTPYYFNHEMAIGIAGATAVPTPTDRNFQIDIDAIRNAITDRTCAVVTISPNNPTGAVYSKSALDALNKLCRAHGIYHIHDEAYEYFTYDGVEHFSPGADDESAAHTISLYSLSKAYGFASWRVGYMVIPDHLFEAVRKIQDTNLICAPVISQMAAVGALSVGADYCRRYLIEIAEIRALAMEEFNTIRAFCEVPQADGAFYFLLKINTPLSPMALVEQLICDHGVAVIPGTTFGIEKGCTIRVAYGALEKRTIAEGIGRLIAGLKAIVGR